MNFLRYRNMWYKIRTQCILIYLKYLITSNSPIHNVHIWVGLVQQQYWTIVRKNNGQRWSWQQFLIFTNVECEKCSKYISRKIQYHHPLHWSLVNSLEHSYACPRIPLTDTERSLHHTPWDNCQSYLLPPAKYPLTFISEAKIYISIMA